MSNPHPTYIHPDNTGQLIHGDKVTLAGDHRRRFTVDTTGTTKANVVDTRGEHHAYTVDQIDRVA